MKVGVTIDVIRSISFTPPNSKLFMTAVLANLSGPFQMKKKKKRKVYNCLKSLYELQLKE